MRSPTLFVCLLLASAFVVPVLRAQDSASVPLATLATAPPLHLGQVLRVRVGPRRMVGRLREVHGDTLRLQLTRLASFTRAAPITATTVLQVRAGRASRWRGAALGAVGGAAAGLLLGATIVDAFHGDVNDVGPVSGVFLPYTIPAGALFGALLPGDRWARVRLTPRQ